MDRSKIMLMIVGSYKYTPYVDYFAYSLSLIIYGLADLGFLSDGIKSFTGPILTI